jgi:hypothetical protein
MKSIRQFALTAMLTIGAFSAITYTACNKDACADVNCGNGGTCVSGTCTCSTGYEGTTCQTLSRDKFVKTWNAGEATSGSAGSNTQTYTASISPDPSSTDVTKVIIGNISNSFFTNPVHASITATTITIPSQQPDNDGYAIEGSGTYANSRITWNYSITKASTADVVNVTGTWQ